MKLQSAFARRLAGFTVSSAVQLWMSTLDYKVAYYDPTVDPAREDNYGRAIYIFWHEYIPVPFFARAHCEMAMLLSRHRDADWLAEAARFAGFDSVRGSTFHGGGAALRELARKAQDMHLAITPDGPRGPRRKLAQGPIYLASKLQMPLIALGVGYDHPWRMNTWDRFAIPRPFTRCRTILSERIPIPADLGREGVEHYRLRVETLLNRLNDEAEAWAVAGTRKENEVATGRRPAPLRRRVDAAHGSPSPKGRPTVPALARN